MATIQQIEATLAQYEAARAKILEGNQSYQIGRRQYTKANLTEVQTVIDRLEARLENLKNGGVMPSGNIAFGGRRS